MSYIVKEIDQILSNFSLILQITVLSESSLNYQGYQMLRNFYFISNIHDEIDKQDRKIAKQDREIDKQDRKIDKQDRKIDKQDRKKDKQCSSEKLFQNLWNQ